MSDQDTADAVLVSCLGIANDILHKGGANSPHLARALASFFIALDDFARKGEGPRAWMHSKAEQREARERGQR